MSNYDPRYAQDDEHPFYIPGYGNFPRAVARKAKKLFRARDNIRAAEGKDSALANEIDAALKAEEPTARSHRYWQDVLEPKVDDWYEQARKQ